ncbi:hypothetical protein NKH18_41075 [Streptomyces sp. M10(2022)]
MFRLALRTEDDTGEAAVALRAAGRLVADPKVLAVVGPTTDVVAGDLVGRYGRPASAWSRSPHAPSRPNRPRPQPCA